MKIHKIIAVSIACAAIQPSCSSNTERQALTTAGGDAGISIETPSPDESQLESEPGKQSESHPIKPTPEIDPKASEQEIERGGQQQEHTARRALTCRNEERQAQDQLRKAVAELATVRMELSDLRNEHERLQRVVDQQSNLLQSKYGAVEVIGTPPTD